MRRQTTRTTKPHPAGFRAKATLACPGHDQLTLELGQATEHGKHQSTMGCCGIGPSILEALEAGATLADGSQDVEQVARRSGQPIKTRHQQHVARAKAVTARSISGASRMLGGAAAARAGVPATASVIAPLRLN